VSRTQITQADVLIRHRDAADIPASARILRQVHASDGYPVEGVADAQSWLEPAALIQAWVAEVAGEVVGHVAIFEAQEGDPAVTLWHAQSGESAGSTGAVAVLGRLFVLTTARGMSIGELLVRACMKDADRRGIQLLLDVMAKDQDAIRLYERLAWRRLGPTTHKFGAGESTAAYCYAAPPPGSVV
jgi:GNAT superfamily N-acetyltransferase